MLAMLPTMEAETFHACVTDPPYHLTSIVKRFGSTTAAPAQHGTDGAFARASRGFMGKTWDGGDIAFRPETWAEVLRVLKPGAHLLVFGGTRTFARMSVAIEDAGFEIRDTCMWLYGSGFPKSHNQGGGWGTALKPAWEPIIVARKPLVGTVAANVLAYGCGALNIDASRVEGGPRPLIQSDKRLATNTYGAGLGGSVMAGETALGRWPANVMHDGSDEVLAAFAAYGDCGAITPVRGSEPSVPAKGDVVYGFRRRVPALHHGDTGTAARFFYAAKASKADRAGSAHPTVKPISLLRYLCRMITPPGGTILDPFAGSGTTGMAAMTEGFSATLIEREAEYVADIRRRIAHVSGADAPLFAAAAP